MRNASRAATAVALSVALAAAPGCEVEPYCIGESCVDVGLPDGADADGDGSGDFQPTDDGALPDGVEDGGDAGDADGADVACDDGVNLLTDPANCGRCGNRCGAANALVACADGECRVTACYPNFVDCDGAYENGCEYYCVRDPRLTEPCDPATCTGHCDTTCDNRDQDCNCARDDCVDKTTDPDNCGACGNRCRYRYPNATADCVGGACTTPICNCGYWNTDGDNVNGCEYECGPTTGAPPACDAPPAEVCNGIDDDCDGAIDEGDPGGGGACGTDAGECEFGVDRCMDARITCVGGVGPVEERCNGLDDDCNGETDEGDPEGGRACGLTTGECEQGLTQCRDGAVVCVGDIRPVPEMCNGRDDDCDGAIDDSPVLTISCTPPPPGICVPGTPACVGGIEVCNGEAPGAPETCNDVDDDCNGLTDDGLFRSCGTDVGECVAGTEACVRGTWGGCTGSVGPATETCDGRDNDCDGIIDGLTRTCGADVGVCTLGRQTCAAGAWGACYGGITPRAEVCDGLDNDCDGATDEGNPGGGAPCGMSTGECRPGGVQCTGGVLVCTGGVGPAAEVCDGRDNDCDGATDEGNPGGGGSCYTGPAGTSGIGICRAGVVQCSGGALVCTGQTLPAAETCNGIDDDCNGAVDNGNPGGGGSCYTGPAGTAGVGICRAGTLQCTGSRLVCTGEVLPRAETCNNIDDDCNGVTDNGNPGGGAACGSAVGECRQGTTQCAGGTVTCVGAVGPATETCNGRDDDCDGVIDDSPTLTITCTPPPLGICTAGTPACVGGVQVCAGEVPGVPEICNGIDDDCDTLTDEGFDLAIDPRNCGVCGRICNLPNVSSNVCIGGVCRVGACAAGYWDVDGNPANGCEYACTYNGAETCNGRDDDCDTLTDAADPDMAATQPSPAGFCNTTGACSTATVQCGLSGGTIRWYCQYSPPVVVDAGGVIQPETRCNGIDEDCDGTTDENWPGVRHSGVDPADPCSVGIGACQSTGVFVCSGDGLSQVCNATAGAPVAESCNGIDDNCDGQTDNIAQDNFAAWGAVQIQGWVDANRPRDGARESARNFYVMRWEASRPDATATSTGTITNQRVCSRAGVLPWTDITWTQARDACCRLNNTGTCDGTGTFWGLCHAWDWELACELSSTATYYTYPYGNTYQPNTCNGNDFDTNTGVADDQDDILATGAMTGCRNRDPFPPSNSWIFDASGNVKEWTRTGRVVSGTTYYEIRGGASNNAASGLTCPFDFTLGSVSFAFPNLGFRCCYYP